MASGIMALVEIYECERGSTTNKTFAGKMLFMYSNEKFPTPKDFAEYLEKIGQEMAKQKGIKGKVSVEMPNNGPTVYQLREKIIIIDKVFIINLFIE
ncbi:MAG: hypothetical protein Q7S81_03050 [bacterium]|nr:hypothetical protein [bacterium]